MNYHGFEMSVRVAFSPPPPAGSDPDEWHTFHHGALPLGWVSEFLASLHVLLRHCCAVTYSLESESDVLVDADEEEIPQVNISSGSLQLEFVTNDPTIWSANALALLGLVLKVGPQLGGLPHRVRERWYLDAARAENAKHALQVVRDSFQELPEHRLTDGAFEQRSLAPGTADDRPPELP